MRVISQCGKYDLPYENFVFICERTMINAVSVFGNGTKQFLVAQYETPERAEKAMEVLHNTFESSLYSDHAFDNAAQVQRPYVFVENRIFRFPAEDEIEVNE